jgi:predicted dehydrogenase
LKTYNVGIIGFGFIGKVHAFSHHNLPYLYDSLPFQTRITRVCTSRPESAEKARQFLGAELGTTDFRDITECPDIDIVHICSPNHQHRAALLSAMAAGKDIYCDKPIVATLEEAQDIQTALDSYTGISQMTFQNRFYPATLRAAELVRSGCLGKILQFRCAYLHAGSANPETPLKWKLSGAAGGGVVADLGSHAMDLMYALLGDYAEVLSATRIAYADRPSVGDPAKRVPVDAEDLMLVTARMADGALGTIEATKLATGTEDEMRFEIHGSDGALRFNGMKPHWLEYYDAKADDSSMGGVRGWTAIDCGMRYPAPAGMLPGKACIGWVRSHVHCLYNFMDAVHNRRPTQPDLAHGIRIQALMDAVLRSARSGQWVPCA